MRSMALFQPAMRRREHRRAAARAARPAVLDGHVRAARSALDWVRAIVAPSVQQQAPRWRPEKHETVASPRAQELGETVRPVSRVAPPRNVASGLLWSGAGWTAWVACARLWTLRKSAASARPQAGVLRRAPAAVHRCPIDYALLASVRPVVPLAGWPVVPLAGWPVVLLAKRPSSALERQVP